MITIKNNKLINYGNRGMTLENDINLTNDYYKEKKIALIYKKPIPIKVLRVNDTKTRIKDGFYETKSTLDYSGIYKEKYIEFDAKECRNKTSFPLSNIKEHQIAHIKKVIKQKGIVFLIIMMNDKFYLLKGEDLIAYINSNERKSIEYDYITKYGYIIKESYIPRLKYLDAVDIAYFKEEV